MNLTRVLSFLIILCLFPGCTVPTSSDFQYADHPLGENEVIVEWRLSRYANIYENYPHLPEDSLEAAKYVDPLFRQLIPQIFADIKSRNLKLYEAGNPEEGVGALITNINEKLVEAYNSNWQRLEAFMNVFHLRERRSFSQKGPVKQILELVIITSDREYRKPEKYFGAVRMADLKKLKYQIQLDNKHFDLTDYLSQIAFFKVIPVQMAMFNQSPSLAALNEAFHVKNEIVSGRYGELSFIDESLNLSGEEPIELSLQQLAEFQGMYQFEPDGRIFSNDADTEIHLMIKMQNGQLMAGWSNVKFNHRLYPSGNNRLFSRHGLVLDFIDRPDEKRIVKLTDPFNYPNNPPLIGYLISEE